MRARAGAPTTQTPQRLAGVSLLRRQRVGLRMRVSVVGSACLAALAVLLVAAPAWAQYKVVAPDGRVTYTDRPTEVAPGSRVAPMRATGGVANVTAADPLAGLPTALRQAAQRFPVTLYTSTDCSPCERGRSLLRQRGVPYSERIASSDADVDALQRLSGGRTVPSLAVGQQVLRGLLDSDWQSTLDLAGYPRESALPSNWQPPPVRPIVTANPADDLAAPRTAAQPRTVTPQPLPPRTNPGTGSGTGSGNGPDIRF